MTQQIQRQVDGIISFLDTHAKEFEPFMQEFLAHYGEEHTTPTHEHHERTDSDDVTARERLLTIAILQMRGCPPEGLESASDWLWQHQPTSTADLLAMIDEAVGISVSLLYNGDRDPNGRNGHAEGGTLQ